MHVSSANPLISLARLKIFGCEWSEKSKGLRTYKSNSWKIDKLNEKLFAFVVGYIFFLPFCNVHPLNRARVSVSGVIVLSLWLPPMLPLVARSHSLIWREENFMQIRYGVIKISFKSIAFACSNIKRFMRIYPASLRWCRQTIVCIVRLKVSVELKLTARKILM